MKESFVFYRSFYEAIQKLPEEYQLELMQVIMKYNFEEELPKMSPVVEAMFTLIKPNIDKASERYERCVENGKKGGRPKTETKPKENLNETKKKPNENQDINLNDNDNDNYNDNDNENNDEQNPAESRKKKMIDVISENIQTSSLNLNNPKSFYSNYFSNLINDNFKEKSKNRMGKRLSNIKKILINKKK